MITEGCRKVVIIQPSFAVIDSDIPVDIIVAAWEEAYGKDRVRSWIAMHEKSGGISPRDFDKEEVWKGELDNPADNS